MRPIRFRAWTGKRMIEWEEYQQDNLAPWKPITIDGYPLVHMQFTGLLDRNGKEICEGDILKRYGVYEPLHVYWKAPSFVSTGAAGVGHWYFDEPDAVEIIGNIYESPELLPVKKQKSGRVKSKLM